MAEHVLLTGGRGYVGSAVMTRLRAAGVQHTVLRHSDDESGAPWGAVTHVVNCAALTPTPGATFHDYYAANVEYLRRVMVRARGKHLIHFGTRSVFYRLEDYQVTKLLGCALLWENAAAFRRLDIVTLPTLDDRALVDGLVAQAVDGVEPTVDRLRYEYCARDDVARHVVDGLVNGGDVPLRVEERDLFERVSAASPVPVTEGRRIDRVCRDAGGLTVFSDEVRERLGVHR